MNTRRFGSAQAWLTLALVVPVAGWVLMEAQRVFRAEWVTLPVREQVADWSMSEQGNSNLQDWDAAWASLQAGLALTPDDPTLHELLGNLYSIAGRRDWKNPDKRRQHNRQAATHYEKALALRPGSSAAWAALASARQVMEDDPARVHAAWSQARKLGPFEGHVQPLLMHVVLAQWEVATPAMQDWAKTLFDSSDEQTRAQINVLAKYYGLVFTPDAPAKAP